jgi:hypothetical protein
VGVDTWKGALKEKFVSVLHDMELSCVSAMSLPEIWFASRVPFEWSRLVEASWPKPSMKES